MAVVLDVSPPALRSLTVQGKLSFADDRDIGLETEWIYLPGGELEIGSEARPYRHQATITLTDTIRDEDINTMGDRGILLQRGTLNLHGDRSNTWDQARQHRRGGSSRIDVLDASGWRRGDEIVLASTDFNPRQAERRHVTAISGNTITLDQPLQYMHYGEVTFGVDERGEVGLLTRNILIQASDDAAQSYFGGHIMAMAGSHMYIDGVELNRMGQNMHLARYPIHFHVLGEGQGQYVRNAAIHDTYSRCVTVHGTNDLRIENNVTFNTVGHCFFLEDGIETGNQFVHNLAIQTKCHPTLPCVPTNLAANGENDFTYREPFGRQAISFSGRDTLLPSTTRWRASGSPIRRTPSSTTSRQGSDENGFWLSLPEHPTGAFKIASQRQTIWPRPNADARLQRQRVAFQLRRVPVRPEHQCRQHLRPGRQRVHAAGKSG
jgi:cell migration-inducing and hyaluronan-binding protein